MSIPPMKLTARVAPGTNYRVDARRSGARHSRRRLTKTSYKLSGPDDDLLLRRRRGHLWQRVQHFRRVGRSYGYRTVSKRSGRCRQPSIYYLTHVFPLKTETAQRFDATCWVREKLTTYKTRAT
jgi:hypothetical protein